jgi:hypothetical protein
MYWAPAGSLFPRASIVTCSEVVMAWLILAVLAVALRYP